MRTDLLDAEGVKRACRGATTIYLCAGLVYSAPVWERQWPPIMDHVITAARETGAHLLFFDNVYMYGAVDGPMREDTPYRPGSRKGELRARIANTLMQEVAAGHIRATIARAPDFYGDDSDNSVLDSMIIRNLAAGKRAQWIGDAGSLHSFIYVPDAARGLYILAQRSGSEGGIWHLPTAPALTGNELLHLIATTYAVPNRAITLKKWMLRMVGLFDPTVREVVEMYYQYDRDYVFSSQKFERAFGMQPTPYAEGIAASRLSRA
jgi:nucleoside-diphosphate-sugar epimerase